jgi:phenylalanyl-tRNA synthetase beta chain
VHSAKRALAALGYQETINFSFVEDRWEHELAGNADPIRVLNPIAAPLAVMRSSLLGGLLAVLRHNLARRAPQVRVFETGRVFLRDPQAADGPTAVAGVQQPLRIAALAWGPVEPLQWGAKERAVDFFDVKGDLEALLAPLTARFVPDRHPALHPGRCARVEIDGVAVGHVGELHPRWRQAYDLPSAPVMFELSLDAVLARPQPQPQAVPRQQAALRDLALVVDDAVSHDALVATLAQDAAGLVRGVTLFDIYRLPGGERSLALRLTLLDDEATLTDERIDAALAAALDRAATAHGARLRG